MKNVTIVGVGALGSHVALLLRNVADMKIIDFDKIEMKNVLSQFHGKTHVGKNKTLAVAQTMNFLFGVKVTPLSVKLVENNVEQLFRDTDLVIDCLDNGAGRRVIQNYALTRSIPCLHGALAADGGFGRVCWTETFKVDDEAGAGAATCEDGAHLPFIAIVSAYLARAAQEYLTSGKKIGFSVHAGGASRT